MLFKSIGSKIFSSFFLLFPFDLPTLHPIALIRYLIVRIRNLLTKSKFQWIILQLVYHTIIGCFWIRQMLICKILCNPLFSLSLPFSNNNSKFLRLVSFRLKWNSFQIFHRLSHSKHPFHTSLTAAKRKVFVVVAFDDLLRLHSHAN